LAAVQLKQQRFHHVLLKRKYNYKMAPWHLGTTTLRIKYHYAEYRDRFIDYAECCSAYKLHSAYRRQE
jgi:hypothetical protein